MSKIFWLTDEDADVAGYKRLKLGARSDCPSLVRAVTNSVAGPTAGVQATYSAGGSALAWISDPLDGTALTATAWIIQVWAQESDLLANIALRFQVYRFTIDGGEASTILDDNFGTELATITRSAGRTTGLATATTMSDGDRIVLKMLIDDAGVMSTGYTATLSYNGQRPRSEGDSYIICPDNVSLTAELPATTRSAVRKLIQDNATTNPHLRDQSIDQAWEEALREYTRDRPFEQVDFLSGDGNLREFPLPRKWIHGFSNLREIEYPIYQTQTRSVMEIDDWEIIYSTLGQQPTRHLRFIILIPGSGTNNVLLRYTTRHIHTDEEDTIPPEDLDAVWCLAASYAALILAAEAASTSEPTISADSVQHRDAAQKWQSVAKDLRGRYDQRIRQPESVSAASVTRDWDIGSGIPGESMLFHPKRWH